jgi:hypothetical protein
VPNGSGNDPVSRTELKLELAELVLRLQESFVSRSHFTRVEEELQQQRLRALSREAIREMIVESLRESDARGWTTRERFIGMVLFLITAASFVLNVASVN